MAAFFFIVMLIGGGVLFYFVLKAISIQQKVQAEDRDAQDRAEHIRVERQFETYVRQVRQSERVSATREVPLSTAPPMEQAMEQGQALRRHVLSIIFPEQIIHESDIEFDPEVDSYRWSNNKNSGDTSCSICLDNFEADDVMLTGCCGHGFHRDCVMGWVEIKDECPNCRQVMWDSETFAVLEHDLKSDNVQ